MTKFFAIAAIMILPTLAFAQTIKNVCFYQTVDDKVMVSDHILGDEGQVFDGNLHLSADGGSLPCVW